MNKTIKALALAALFIFPGISGFPQEVPQTDNEAVQSVHIEENINFPILIGIP